MSISFDILRFFPVVSPSLIEVVRRVDLLLFGDLFSFLSFWFNQFSDGNLSVDSMLTCCKFVSFNLMSHNVINSFTLFFVFFLELCILFFINDDNEDGV